MAEHPYFVGQQLWRHDVNGDRRGGPTRAVIMKVGRKLVTAEDLRYGHPEVFRIDTGRTNDAYAHRWLCTDEEHAEHEAMSAALGRLKALHISFDAGGYARHYSAEALNAVADLLEAEKETD